MEKKKILANINIKDIAGNTLLSQTIRFNKRDVFLKILETKPNIDSTVLQSASYNDSPDYIIELLKRRPKLSLLDVGKSNPLILAIKSKKELAVKALLLSGVNRDIVDEEGEIPLLVAIKYNTSDTIINDLLYLKPASPDSLEQELNALKASKDTNHTIIYL